MNSCWVGRFNYIQVGQPPEEPEGTEHEYVENLRIRLENAYDFAKVRYVRDITMT